MELETFLLKDKIKEIEKGFKLNNGWIKIYNKNYLKDEESYGIYCSLIKNNFINNYRYQYNWPINYGYEGKSNVYGDNTYKTYDNDELEPFMFDRNFNIKDRDEKYIDISEEFILYFKLFEDIKDKQNRIYYFVNDYGELDEVLVIASNQVKIKLKYLREYITMRDMYFCISFDFMILLNKIDEDWQIEYIENDFKSDEYYYNHLIRYHFDSYQSWIMGNYFINPYETKGNYLEFDKEKYEDFITGIDDEGNNIFENPLTASKAHFTLTYFKKEVLNKYYNNPNEYEIDGFSISNKFFRLKIDNNLENIVPVFLTDLRILPHSEQLHWKQYNIAIEDKFKISQAFHNTMILGNWHQKSNTVDLVFKEEYSKFNKRWLEKYGWNLYKPLAEEDEYLFKALHLITENNIKSFCEQTLTIVKITIDRINEKEISKGLIIEPNIKGITKFQKFLESKDVTVPDLFEFLRHLQSLRSGLIAHTFSKANKDCKKAMDYFKINEKDYREIHKEIFINSIKTFNTFNKLLL